MHIFICSGVIQGVIYIIGIVNLWCLTFKGQQYEEGQTVYPEQSTESAGVFPDGTPFRTNDRKPRYVFVWKTWGKYFKYFIYCLL